MITLIALAAVTNPQIVPLRTIAASLADYMHKPVHVGKTIQNDLIYLVPNGARPEEIIPLLAHAVHASVTSNGSEIFIERTAKDLKSLHDSRTLERTRWVNDRLNHISTFRANQVHGGDVADAYYVAFKRRSEQISALSSGKPATVAPYFPEQLLPSEVLLESLISRIGVKKLASIESGEVKTFEDSDSNHSLGLPPYDDLVKAYEEAMEPLRRLLSVDRRFEPPAPGMEPAPNIRFLQESGRVQRLRLVVQATENRILLELLSFDDQGHQVAVAHFFAGPTEVQQSAREISQQFIGRQDIQWVSLSTEARAALAFGTKPSGIKWPDWFIHPERQEPLDLFVRETLAGLSTKYPGKPFVMAVSDALWPNVVQSNSDGKINLSLFQKMIEQWTPYEHLTVGGAEIWRPKDIEIDERRLADRKVLGKFARDFQAKGHADVRDVAVLYHDSTAKSGALADIWLSNAHSAIGISPTMNSTVGPELFRVLGGLTDEGWSKLLSRHQVGVEEDSAGPDVLEFCQNSYRLRLEGNPAATDWDRAPNEAVIHTDLTKATISFRGGPIELIEAWNPSSKQTYGLLTPSQFLDLYQVTSRNFKWEGDTPKLSISRDESESNLGKFLFRKFTRDGFDVSINFPPGLSLPAQILGNIIPTSDQFTFDQLPQKFRDDMWQQVYERALEGARKNRDHTQTEGPQPSSLPRVPQEPL